MPRAEMRFEQTTGAIHVPLSPGYQNLKAEGFHVEAFWSHVKNAIELAKVNGLIKVPHDDSETLARLLREYFEHNSVYEMLEDKTLSLTLVLYQRIERLAMKREITIVKGTRFMRPETLWSLMIKDKD
jgi:hypothetical protein